MSRFIQFIIIKITQFFCNHKWVNLKHHQLPGEPYLKQCAKCKFLAYGWTDHFKAKEDKL